MTHAAYDGLTKAFPDAARMLLPVPRQEVVAALSEALGPDWAVERETDYEGEVSIIALSTLDLERMPAVILYEKEGMAHVATMKCDEWENDLSFASFQQATDAFIAEARASSNRA